MRIKRSLWECINDLDFTNTLLAGGSVSKLLTGVSMGAHPFCDADLFLYGLSPERADDKVRQIIEHIKSKNTVTSIIKTANVIAIKVNTDIDNDVCHCHDDDDSGEEPPRRLSDRHQAQVGRPTKLDDSSRQERDKMLLIRNMTREYDCETVEIQIILRIYSSISEILHGFDFGSCAVGYDGHHVYFTSLSAYSYANAVNVLDTTRRSTTYERRLAKYVDRGFRVVLPNMDTSKITDDVKEILLPFCELNLKQTPAHMPRAGEDIWMIRKKGPLYDYDTTGSGPLFRALTEEWTTERGVIMPRGKIAYLFSKGQEAMLNNYHADQLSVDQVLKIFGPKIAVEFIEKKESIKPKIDAILALNASEATDKYLAHVTSTFFPLKWLTVDPGTQLTSSFNPVLSDPKEWYGEWFTPTLQAPEKIAPKPADLTIPEDLMCCVCWATKKSDRALIPCGHTQYCDGCLKRLNFPHKTKICCLCREPVKMVIKLR